MAERLTQDDCEELWLISQDDWVLPVSAIPVTSGDKKLYAVADVIGFDRHQWEAVHAILTPASVGIDGIFWIIPRIGLSAVATKAQGIHPKWYVKWQGRSPVKPKLEFGLEQQIETPEPTAATREFIDHIALKARALSREDVLFVWECIVSEIPKWLTEKRKPISFGYFSIWALPYRTNWKQVLLAKYPNVASTMRMSKEKRNARLSLTTFERDIQHTDLVEFHADTKTIGWTIEAVPTKHWDEWIQDAESKRRKHLGPTNYAKVWSRLIWKLQNIIYDLFGSFVAKTVLPCAEPVKRGGSGGLSFGPCTPMGAIKPVSRDLVETRCVYYDNSRPVVASGEPQSMAETIEPLPPPLSPLLLASEDVWDSGRVLPSNGDGNA